MYSSAPLSPEVLDEDLQIVLATLAVLGPQVEKLTPASSRALDDAIAKVAEARDLLERARLSHDDPAQLSFSLHGASG